MRLLKKFILVLFFVNLSIEAKLYSSLDIRLLTESPKQLDANREFVNQFFTTKNPNQFINKFLTKNDKKKINFLVIEYQLNQLLNEISYHSKQPFLVRFVEHMKDYQSQAIRLYEEGYLKVAVFNLSAKAKGIENIWFAEESFNRYVQLFDSNPIQTLENLRNKIEGLGQPQWFGLKRSIMQISADKQAVIVDYLLNNPTNLIGLDKFVSRYTLTTVNKDLLVAGIAYLNASNREYLLRHMGEYFDYEFVREQLLNAASNSQSKAFAMSLLKPFSQEDKVRKFLIQSLKDEEVSQQAAFVIAGIDAADILQQLEIQYYVSDSKQQKQAILLVLQLSLKVQSKQILDRIKHQETVLQQNAGRIK